MILMSSATTDSTVCAKGTRFLDFLPPTLEAHLSETFGEPIFNRTEREDEWTIAWMDDADPDALWAVVTIYGPPASRRVGGKTIEDWFFVVNQLEKTAARKVRH